MNCLGTVKYQKLDPAIHLSHIIIQKASDNIGLIKNLNQAIKNNNKSEINKDIRKVSEKFQNMTN